MTHPTHEAEGLLWVWPSSGKEAEAEAKAAGYPGIAPEVDSEEFGSYVFGGWYVRCA